MMARFCEHCGSVLDDELASLTFGDLSIVGGSHEVWCNDRRADITAQQEHMLADLMRGKPVSREAAIMRHAKSEDTFDRSFDVLIFHLRGKLRGLRSICRIKTLSGLGWQLVADGSAYEQEAFGDVVLDLDRRLLLKGNAFTPINPKTIEVMKALLSGELESREKLLKFVDGNTAGRRAANLRTQILYARRALEELGSKVVISNFADRGYQLVA